MVIVTEDNELLSVEVTRFIDLESSRSEFSSMGQFDMYGRLGVIVSELGNCPVSETRPGILNILQFLK